MRVIVTGCADCPFKKVATSITCKITKADLMGPELGSVDVISSRGIHPGCPMLNGRIAVVLEPRTVSEAGKSPEAFLGNRVQLNDGTRGAIVGKYKNAEDAGLKPESLRDLSKDTLNGKWYAVLLDGNEITIAAAATVAEIIKDQATFNFNREFEFYFGFGEDDQ